ncbi:MAG: HAD-IA family hydrolase [Casimicrobiaceae bacterium]|nr:HAD-IA family hydrolase [Casimicrobiaceae bacterium]MCX8097933.1 HAD-IA family hydrolase [Casimicrobiaceae bacterium]MDW8312874.1 HAD-IA family hydrolase [Burkholderiales bacterium]
MSEQTARRFDLVLFDLDGTLIETAPEIQDAVNDTLEALGLEPVDLETVVRWIGHGTRELLVSALASRRALEREAVALAEDFDAVQALYASHYRARCGTRSRPYEGMRETIEALRDAGIRVAILTNKEARYTQAVLEAHRLEDAFDLVIAGDTLPRKKPDPAGIDFARERFGVGRERTLLVGDSAIDVAAARHAGVAVWVFPWGYNLGRPIAESAPDRVLSSYAELRAALLGAS